MSASPSHDAFDNVIRSSATSWLELRGTILDQERNELTQPNLRANWMQLEEERILKWKEEHGYMGRIIKLKGRRQGSSTGTILQMTHRMRVKATAAIICGLEYGKNVKAMEEMFWTMVDKDRHDWGVSGHQLKGEGGTFTNNSKLTLISANNPDTGKGDGAQFILMTEAAYYPKTPGRNESDLMRSLFQLVPRKAGTVIVMESTPNGEGGEFHEAWVNAITFEELQEMHAGLKPFPKNWNGFVKIFYPWHKHPDYTLECTDREAEEIEETLGEREAEILHELKLVMSRKEALNRLKWRRFVLNGQDFKNDEDQFEKEYPSDEFRCFATSGRKIFYWKSVKAMKEVAAVKLGDTGYLSWSLDKLRASFEIAGKERDAWFRRFAVPQHGDSHLIMVDTMTGDQAGGPEPDNHAPLVLRAGHYRTGSWTRPAVVGRICDVYGEEHSKRRYTCNCRWGIDILAERVAAAAAYYGNCIVAVEVNNDPGLIMDLRKRTRVHLYQREETLDSVEQITKKYFGWKTTPQNRRAVLSILEAAVRNRTADGGGIDIPDIRILTEMDHFVAKENGRQEAGPGWKDDTVISLAIGYSLLGKATAYVDRAAVRDWYEEGGEDGDRGNANTWGV